MDLLVLFYYFKIDLFLCWFPPPQKKTVYNIDNWRYTIFIISTRWPLGDWRNSKGYFIIEFVRIPTYVVIIIENVVGTYTHRDSMCEKYCER